MGIIQILIVIMIFVNLLFSGMLYFYGNRRWIEVLYALTSFFASVWSLATLVVGLPHIASSLFRFAIAAHYVSGALAYSSMLWFAVINSKKTQRHAPLLPVFVSVTHGVTLGWMLLQPASFFEVKESTELSEKIIFQFPGYALFVLSLTFVFFVTLFYLFREYKQEDPLGKLPMRYILFATLLGGSSGIMLNLYFPWIGDFRFFTINPIIVSLFFTGISFFTLVRYRLFDIKIIGVELFAFIIWLLSFIQIFFSPLGNQQLLSGSIFVLTLFFGVLLIRSIRNEVQVRERVEHLAHKLQRANKELERISRAKSDFLSAASHQLKTPLSIIKGYVAMMLEGTFGTASKEIRRQLKKVYISNERLIGLVNDLLDFSGLEEGRIQYNFEIIDLRALITSVVNELKAHTIDEHIAVYWNDDTTPLYARADESKIRSVIFNLVDNAVKYTHKGSITVEAYPEETKAVIEVRDTGRGMSETDLKKIFQKFQRGKEEMKIGSRQVSAAGFGLGLYIARFIIKDHQGTITASSEGPGKGSTFRVALPLASLEKGKKDGKVRQQE